MASPPPQGNPPLLSSLEPYLDYNEDEEEEKEVEKRRTSSHTHSRLLSEDGELASDEDGEIKEATPLSGNSSSRCEFERRSDESLQPRQTGHKQAHNSNICRHFLQGRCSWGDDCRFIHKLPEGEEIGGERNEGDVLHNSPHLSLHPPTLYAISREPIPIDRIHTLYDRVIPSSAYSHMTWAAPPSRLKDRTRGLPRPSSQEKVEESVGWHRLRTITKGWESEEEEEEEEERKRRRSDRKGRTDDLRTKLKQKRQYAPSSDDSENDTDSKLKKRKRIKKEETKETKQVFDRGDDWFDPWSRKKIKDRRNEFNSSSPEEKVQGGRH